MSVSINLQKIRSTLPREVKLIAVSKTMPDQVVMEAYEAGQRAFGENKAQDMSARYPRLPQDCEWHFIGHLQTNKVKYIAPFVSMIHSVDSFRLLQEINRQAAKHHRIIPCLLQFYIAEEETKFGLDRQEAAALLQTLSSSPLMNVRIAGVMGMATYTDNMQQVRREFAHLRQEFEWLKHNYFPDNEYFKEISMGMTNDYQVAVDEGSTMVRIGSAIFGDRHYR
ncbi:MAG TPA: YggS family pyridoxal phosphate-dependent enzyme [Bacteroidales bacterium]|nr:YggS family pyridoxal phosphate-dependent enzyme [Bacteroidales bacterium]